MLNYELDIKPILDNISNDGIPKDSVIGKYYKESVELAERYKETFSDKYPKFLDINRPREKEIHKEYKRAVYENVLKDFPTKVFNMLESIRQNDDYEIYWPESDKELQQYFEQNETEEWIFKFFVDKFIFDPNAVMFVLPKQPPLSQQDFTNPIPQIVESKGVFHYRDKTKAVLMTDELVRLWDEKHQMYTETGRVYYFIDSESYTRCEQIVKKTDGSFVYNIWGMNQVVDDVSEEVIYTFTPPLHNYKNGIPAWKVGERLSEYDSNGNQFFVSIIDNAIPHLRNAAAIYLDMQIERNHHVHTVEWMVAPQKSPCSNPLCRDGMIRQDPGVVDGLGRYIEEKCTVCARVDTSLSNMDVLIVNPPQNNAYSLDQAPSLNISGPPAGYIKRNIEALQTFRKEFDKEMQSAFATINAEFISFAPLSESGKSKSYDRQEYYRLLARIADHLKRIIYGTVKSYNEIRFQGSKPMPSVVVPIDTFDLSREEELWEAIVESYQYGGDTEIQKGLEYKYAVKRFGKNSPEAKRMELLSKIDPFYYMEENNKLEALLLYKNDIQARYKETDDKRKKQVDKVLWSINAYSWVKRAETEHDDFLLMPFIEQFQIINQYAQEEIPTELAPIMLKEGEQIPVEPLVDMQQNDQLKGK